MDYTTDTSNLEKLANQIHRRVISVACVRLEVLYCIYSSIELMVVHCRFNWGISAIFLGVYAIVQDLNIPLIVQPQLFATFCLASWAQVWSYFCVAARTFDSSAGPNSACTMGGGGQSVLQSLRG